MLEILRKQVDIRSYAQPIDAEVIVIPSDAPFKKTLCELPEPTGLVTVSRLTQISRVTNYGSACDPILIGAYTGAADGHYVVQIDTGGEVGTATFRWSRNGGADWAGSLIKIEDSDPIEFEEGLSVQFPVDPVLVDYVLSERWEFYAEKWTEVSAVPASSKEFSVNYANGVVEFHSSDSGKSIHAFYYGKGSIVSADDVNQIIDWLNSGSPVILGGVVTTNFQKGDLVGHDRIQDSPTYRQLVKASAGAGNAQVYAIGMVVKVDAVGEILLFGLRQNPRTYAVQIEAGREYYLSELTPGAWSTDRPTLGGSMIQLIGTGVADDTLLLNISQLFSVNLYKIVPVGVLSGEYFGTPTVT